MSHNPSDLIDKTHEPGEGDVTFSQPPCTGRRHTQSPLLSQFISGTKFGAELQRRDGP